MWRINNGESIESASANRRLIQQNSRAGPGRHPDAPRQSPRNRRFLAARTRLQRQQYRCRGTYRMRSCEPDDARRDECSDTPIPSSVSGTANHIRACENNGNASCCCAASTTYAV